MKLAIVERGNPFKDVSGTDNFLRALIPYWLKRGHEIHLIHSSSDSSQGKRCRNFFSIPIRAASVPYVGTAWFVGQLIRELRRLEKQDFDAVIGFGAGTGFGSAIRAARSRLFSVYYAIDVLANERRRLGLETRGLTQTVRILVAYKLLTEMDKHCCHSSRLIMASCKDTAKGLASLYAVPASKIRICYLGIPDDYTEGYDAEEPSVPTFLHISTEPTRKGTLYFIEAMRILRDMHRIKAHGIISPRWNSVLFSLALKYRLDVDFLSNVDIRQEYARCTALVSPSLSEGFCLPVVEAASFGKPSVVTSAGSLGELVSDGLNGIVVPPRDPIALASAMGRLVVDGSLRARLSKGAKTFAGQFKISAVGSRLERIIDQCRPS